MPFSIHATEQYLQITYEGSFSLTNLEESRTQAAGQLLVRGATKILLDFTHARPQTSFTELFTFAGDHSAEIPPHMYTASVIPRKRVPEFYAYLASLTKTFDTNIAYFDTLQEAERWLISLH